jgi:hypothetical protein
MAIRLDNWQQLLEVIIRANAASCWPSIPNGFSSNVIRPAASQKPFSAPIDRPINASRHTLDSHSPARKG